MVILDTDKWQEDKGFMVKSGPTYFCCCSPPQCLMALRSLFSKAPDPPRRRRFETRKRFGWRGGPRCPAQREARSAGL